MAGDTRLDVCVAKQTGCSRAFAGELIRGGCVGAAGKVLTKPGMRVFMDCVFDITMPENIYVGRGGYKLEYALDYFAVNPDGCICADIGAATGGFTDCMLRRGAKKVYAIDNGHAQLAEVLRKDARVVSLEGLNINDIGNIYDIETNHNHSAAEYGKNKTGIGENCVGETELINQMDFIAVDVSFVSLTKVMNAIVRLARPRCEMILLVKPQFEAGREAVRRSGIIRDKRYYDLALDNVRDSAQSAGLSVKGSVASPVLGKEGNQEFLMHCIKCQSGGKSGGKS